MNTRNHSYYRYASYATPSATWTYDCIEQVVTLFWKQNAKQIQYKEGCINFQKHKARILRRANTYGIL
jgi:hypothetical protein